MSNIVYVCPRCHCLIHQGLLTITGEPVRGLSWKVACEDMTRSVRAALDQSMKEPLIRVLKLPDPSGSPDGSPDAKTGPAPELATIVLQALEKLGWPRGRARDLLARAWERFQGAGRKWEASDAAALVREANQIGLGLTWQSR